MRGQCKSDELEILITSIYPSGVGVLICGPAVGPGAECYSPTNRRHREAYSENTGLFAEWRLLIVGRDSADGARHAWGDRFKPYAEGQATLTWPVDRPQLTR